MFRKFVSREEVSTHTNRRLETSFLFVYYSSSSGEERKYVDQRRRKLSLGNLDPIKNNRGHPCDDGLSAFFLIYFPTLFLSLYWLYLSKNRNPIEQNSARRFTRDRFYFMSLLPFIVYSRQILHLWFGKNKKKFLNFSSLLGFPLFQWMELLNLVIK